VVNGSAEFIGPDVKIDAVTDSRGAVGIFDRVRSLTPAIYRFDIDGIGAFDVNPAGGVHQRFQAMTGDELRAATIPGRRRQPAHCCRTSSARATSAVRSTLIAASLNHGAALATGTNGIGAGIRAAARARALQLGATTRGAARGLQMGHSRRRQRRQRGERRRRRQADRSRR
jgi:hypothetical protein